MFLPTAPQWGELHGNLSLAPWQADADAFKVRPLRLRMLGA